VLNNVVMIGTLVLFMTLYGTEPAHFSAASWDAGKIGLLAGGATLGVALQAALLVPFWRATGLRFRPDFRWRGVGLGAPARAAGWVFGMVLVVQATNLVQTIVAVRTDPGDASLPVLRITWLIFMLSHSIIAISIATPYFTRMSHAARDADIPALRADLAAALRSVAMLVTGAGAALAAAALPFAAFFDEDSAPVIAVVLLAFLVGLVPFSTLYLVQRAFYALGDTRTPFLLQVVQGVLFIGGAFALLAAPSEWIAAGIGLVGGGRALVRRFGVYALASIPAAAAGVAVLHVLGGFATAGFATAGRVEAFASTALVGGSALLVFLLVLVVFRAPETSLLRSLLRR
jgi:putative peptidoglycan lipid II flippase